MKMHIIAAAAALLLPLAQAPAALGQAASGAIGASKTRGVAVSAPQASNGVGLYWPEADQKKAIAPGPGDGFNVYTWTPGYRVALRRVGPSKGTSEMHEDKAQLYVVLSGTGTHLMGGKPATMKDVGEGNHISDSPLEGATTYKLKPGDVVVIPPLTWHQTGADPGQTMTYRLIDVTQPTRMP